MKSFLVSCLLFFSLSLSAQDIYDLVNEAADLFKKEQYDKAIPSAEKAALAVKQAMGENNIFYTGLLTIQAASYKNTFQYIKAEPLYLRIKELLKNTSGENTESYTACLHNLAGLYYEMGQYEKAEPVYLQALTIAKTISGENSPAYGSTLNSLAVLYSDMGQYEKAEPISIQATAIRKKALGESDPGYATSLNNLAILYTTMGQYEKAEPLFTMAIAIRKKALGENHPDYATSLNNLASLMEDMEQYERAESLYIQSKDIRKRTIGENHPDYAASLNNLASLYTHIGQYKKAEPLIIQAKEIWKKALGENSPAYATSANNLAAFYRRSQTQYAKAEALYLEAIRLRKMILGERHPLYGDSQTDLGLLYSQMGQPEKAAPLLQSGSNILLQNLSSTFSILSEKEKGNYLTYNISTLDVNNSFLYNYPKASAADIRNSLNLLLGFKSLSLADTRNMLESVRNSRDSSIKRLFNEWQVQKNLLSKQYALPVTSRIPGIKKVEEETEVLEKELTRRSASFRNQQTALRISMQEVQKNMEPDEAAIEFVRFKLYTKKLTDSVIYAAYVFRKNDAAPHFVPLCEKGQLQRLFDSAGRTATSMVKSFYRGIDIKNRMAGLGTALYKLVWQPLESFLPGIKKISYSPAGRLYSIAFQALPVDSMSVLMDKYRLQQYTSTRQIALRTTENKVIKPGNIGLFGDADFAMDSLALVKQRKSQSSSVQIIQNRGSSDIGGWPGLPGTAEEVKKIQQLFAQNKIAAKLFVRENATEENLKAMNGNAPEELHIATHGFFLPDPGDKKKKNGQIADQGNTYKRADDPLMRSGLVLAGGNYAWSGKTPVEGVEDGIVTAYEISQLNLSSTELLVLSACETALGDIKGSEGVFGLQRGFKLAGVKKMIVSLWQVPDKETAELMTTFYSYWLKGKTISEAFYQAQTDMRGKYAPFYWAAFVLVE